MKKRQRMTRGLGPEPRVAAERECVAQHGNLNPRRLNPDVLRRSYRLRIELIAAKAYTSLQVSPLDRSRRLDQPPRIRFAANLLR